MQAPLAHRQRRLHDRRSSIELLVSVKGHHGGFRLARPPSEITLSEILDAIDEGIDPDYCAFGFDKCDPRNPCPLHPLYSQLSEA